MKINGNAVWDVSGGFSQYVRISEKSGHSTYYVDISLGVSPRAIELLTLAVNNRTRERNYFRLYTQLLEKEITEEEFDKELDENQDEYLSPSGTPASLEEVRLAVRLCKNIKDVEYVDDMEHLFSFNNAHKLLEANGKR